MAGARTYEGLPEHVKTQITEREWLWLSDKEKDEYLPGLYEPPADAEEWVPE